MPSPPLKNFCHCATLPTGGIIIGGLQIAYYVITLICVTVMLIITHGVRNAILEQAKEEGEDQETIEAFGEAFGHLSSGILWPILAFRVIGIVTSICLIIGSQKRSKQFLLGYLIFEGIGFLALVLVWFFAVPGKGSTVGGFLFFLFLTMYMILNKYFWLCVLSLYMLISNEQRGDLNNGEVNIPLQTIPENQRIYMPANNAYPSQQQPLYIPQPTNAMYPQQKTYPGQQPPAYPVQIYHPADTNNQSTDVGLKSIV